MILVLAESGRVSPEISREDLRVETQKCHEDEERSNRQHLGYRGHHIQNSRLAHTAGEHQEDGPGECRDEKRLREWAGAIEKRDEEAQGAEEQGGVAHLSDDGSQPITPRGGKAHEIAQTSADIRVNARI